jgi:hypothetical protein
MNSSEGFESLVAGDRSSAAIAGVLGTNGGPLDVTVWRSSLGMANDEHATAAVVNPGVQTVLSTDR